MLIIDKLMEQTFPSSQETVVQFLLENRQRIKPLSMRQIAAACYSSNASLVRLARSLGYPTWETFKEAFIAEQDYLDTLFTDTDPNIPFSEEDTAGKIMNVIAELETLAVKDTRKLLDPAILSQASRILLAARHITVMGLNNLQYLAQLFCLKAGRIGLDAQAPQPGELLYTDLLYQEQNALVILSYSGQTASLLRFARIAREHRVPVIAITSVGDSSLAKSADLVLPICTREKLTSKIGWYTTEPAFQYVLDLLYSLCFQNEYERRMQEKFSRARWIEQGRQASSSIMEE